MISYQSVLEAECRLKHVKKVTPLEERGFLQGTQVYFKREDKQLTGSFKFRGAYNCLSHMDNEREVVCASTGNHAQGFALSCFLQGKHGKVFLPALTPQTKKDKTAELGLGNVEVVESRGAFDESLSRAKSYCQQTGARFVHPFDDEQVVSGQGTVGFELFDAEPNLDYVFVGVGGGGLVGGVGSYLKCVRPQCKIVGVEPFGADAMYQSLRLGSLAYLNTLDTFVDGVAVREVSHNTMNLCKSVVDDFVRVSNVCVEREMRNFYLEGEHVEPAGALSVAGMIRYARDHDLSGKKVVCVISGGNVDASLLAELRNKIA